MEEQQAFGQHHLLENVTIFYQISSIIRAGSTPQFWPRLLDAKIRGSVFNLTILTTKMIMTIRNQLKMGVAKTMNLQ